MKLLTYVIITFLFIPSPTQAISHSRKPKKHHHLSTTNAKHSDLYDKIDGIPERLRYKIWLIINAADDRAFRQAGGNPVTGDSSNMSNGDFGVYQKLNEQYQDQIGRRHHITYGQISAISAEAYKKHWPGSW